MLIVNRRTFEYLDPLDFGEPNDLYRAVMVEGGVLAVLAILLRQRWAGDPIEIVGDLDECFALKQSDDYYNASVWALKVACAAYDHLKAKLQNRLQAQVHLWPAQQRRQTLSALGLEP